MELDRIGWTRLDFTLTMVDWGWILGWNPSRLGLECATRGLSLVGLSHILIYIQYVRFEVGSGWTGSESRSKSGSDANLSRPQQTLAADLL